MSPLKNNLQDPDYYIQGVLRGELAVLSRAITMVESTRKEHQEFAAKILSGIAHKTGQSFRLGITGVPGVGKSTFIESFGKEVVRRGHKLAVLAIDPSSNKSKGSILGDKTRMEQLSVMENVFVRPSPSSGTLGGVARATYETMLLCEAAGYDYIIVETVGVGQSEVAVSRLTDFFLLLMLAGAGDELQGIKRGIMEMADSIVITKADGANLEKAKAARIEFARAIHFLEPPQSGFTPRVELCSSIENKGIAEVYEILHQYRSFVTSNSYLLEKRKTDQMKLLKESIDEKLKLEFYSHPKIKEMLHAIEITENSGFVPFTVADELVKQFFLSQKK